MLQDKAAFCCSKNKERSYLTSHPQSDFALIKKF